MSCILSSMAKTLKELEEQKQALKDKAAAEIAAVKKALADRTAAIKASERRLRAQTIKEQKRKDDHAKILVGVASIWNSQQSAQSAEKLKEFLAEFYKDAPEKLAAALYGLSLTVRRPESDSQRDNL